MPSNRYNLFNNRVIDLEILLPTISPIGAYSTHDQDLIKSYCLLVHAEIEAYLEDILLEVTKDCFNKWKADQEAITPIIFNLAFNHPNKDLPASMVNLSFKNYEKSIIGKNNGIKDTNIKSMTTPIGFEMDGPTQLLLTAFGSNRGDIAHNSVHTVKILDPVVQKNNVHLILSALKQFDIDLVNYGLTGSKANVSILNPMWLITLLIKSKYLKKIILKYKLY